MEKFTFMKSLRVPIVMAMIIIIGVGCNATKKVPAGDALYTGATVKIEDNEVDRNKKKQLESDLRGLTRPKPNSRILGIPFKLFLYNLGSDSSKLGRFIRKFGEPPVLLSDVNLERNGQILTNYLENRGFFHAKTAGDTTMKNKKASAQYSVTTKTQYTIKDIVFVQDTSSVLQMAINETQDKTLLKPGQPFDLNLIKAERTRIDAILKERGFYYFSPDYVIVNVDSTVGDSKVNMYVSVKPSTPTLARQPYTINDVYIFANYRLNTANTDTLKNMAQLYRGYHVVDRRKRFKPRVFDQTMLFKPGELYNRRDHNLSLNRLINLGVFKFVKNRFEPVDSPGVHKLDAFYYLTPLPKKSIRFEVGGNTKSNNMTGSNVTVSWRNRNTFREAELLTVNANFGTEVQYSGTYRGFNTYRLGAEAIFSIPRFSIPWIRFNTTNAYVPRTNIEIGYEALNRVKLYTLNSFRGNFGWTWKPSVRKEHVFYLASINYVQPFNVTKRYQDSARNDVTLRNAIDTQFIFGSNYSFTYDQRIDQPNQTGLYFNGIIDLSGNLAGAFVKANNVTGKKEIFRAAFDQYAKIELDTRYNLKVANKTILANRVITGYGRPYGNSRQIPFIKQFFIGGNNSIRAFRSRAVGPGRYNRGEFKPGAFLADQAGDIKLEFNTELRKKFTNIIEGAVFVDAGNIWLYNDDPARPGAKFTKDWSKELAVGTGLGVRLDLTILLLRVDFGIPLRKPFLPEGQRWVIKDIDFSSKEWRKENIILNLAIGYPF
jgi:outer membrane protein insertion porin family